MSDLPPRPPITVVGIGADGWAGLPGPARELVLAAALVLGSGRQLALLPGVVGQTRRPWGSPLDVAVIDEYDVPVLVLGSGDPLVSGIGTVLVGRYGAERVEVVPAVSSVALARARMGWSAEETEVVTVVGRHPETVLRQLGDGRRILVLSSDEETPSVVAGLVTGAGFGGSGMTALGDLGADTETRVDGVAATWAGEVSRLNIVAVEVVGPPTGSWATGLPDDAFEHDGQLTKRDVRASALARLRPQPGELLWDIGAGAGSIAIEWMRAHPTCDAWAVEADESRAERIRRNARRLGVPDLTVAWGRVPEAFAGMLRLPHAVFVGGGATTPGLLDTCRESLRPGGRLVVHGVTLETEQLLARHYTEHGGELTRISVETAAPIGSFTGWTPARAVTQWAWEKPW